MKIESGSGTPRDSAHSTKPFTEGGITGLQKGVNKTAREQYPRLLEITGEKSLFVPSRLRLRRDTEYPYRFEERENLLPDKRDTFGDIVEMDRQTGLQEIHGAVDVVMYEHSWLYVPEEQIWIDNTLKPDYTTVESDSKLVTYLTHMYPEVEMVHTHPTILEGLEGGDPRFNNWKITSAQPSSSDLIRQWQLESRSNPDSDLTTVVVSHYGVTTATRSEYGKATDGYTSVGINFRVDEQRDPVQEAGRGVRALQSQFVDFDHDIPVFDIRFTPIDEI